MKQIVRQLIFVLTGILFCSPTHSIEDTNPQFLNLSFTNFIETMSFDDKLKTFLDKRSTCPEYEGFKFCIFPGNGHKANQVIYYFHGIFGNENQWIHNDITKKLYKMMLESDTGSPTIVSISYGPVWLLTAKNSKKFSGLLDSWNLKNILKFEEKNLNFKVSQRYVFGDSMGGHNGLVFYLKNQDLFKKVILICPATLATSPFEDISNHHELLPEFSGMWPMYYGAMGLMATYYDDNCWQSTSPYSSFAKYAKPKTMVDFIIVNNDMYGFSDAVKKFQRQNFQFRSKIHVEEQIGSHCYPENIESIYTRFN